MLPIATADCDRGFSAMNRIKTVTRNRLKTNTLEQLMFISIKGPYLLTYLTLEGQLINGVDYTIVQTTQ